MAKIDRTLAELRALVKDHAGALTADAQGQLLTLIAQAEFQANDLHAELSEKDDEIGRLEYKLEWAEGESAQRSAELLCDWARGEDPRVVRKVTEAIGGGHASDLSLIFS